MSSFHISLKQVLFIFFVIAFLLLGAEGVFYYFEKHQLVEETNQEVWKEAARQTSERSRAIRGVDFVKFFLGINSGFYERYYAAACGADVTPKITIGHIDYFDLDHDGREEAAITASSCAAKKELPDILGVFRYLPDGAIESMRLRDQQFYQDGNSADIHRLEVKNGKVVETVTLRKKEDPACCPSGGGKLVYFKWGGSDFLVDKVENVVK